MKHLYTLLIAMILFSGGLNAQFSVTINVIDADSGLPLENAEVVLDGNFFGTTDALGNAIFLDIANGEYSFSASMPCYTPDSDNITVEDSDAQTSITLDPMTSNSIFFFVGSPMTIPGASIIVTGDSFFQEITTGAPFGDVMENVPFGDYTYSITTPCFETVSGNVTVNCTNGDGILVFEEPSPSTTNSVFFFVGSPLSISGATVFVSGDNFSQELITGAPFGDVIDNVPFGEYSYSINAPCYEPVNGTFTVDCNNGDGIAVFEEPASSTTNSVFFFVGSPLSISGAVVEVTGDNFTQELITGAPFGDVIDGVPFGTYTYTITADCYETVSGTFDVDCNNGDGIAVFEEPTAVVINSSVTQNGATLQAVASGFTYQWLDCNNTNQPIAGATNSSYTATSNGSYAVEISNDNCSVISECTAVTNLGVNSVFKKTNLDVYPNPFTTSIRVELPVNSGPSLVQIYSLTGQLTYSQTTISDNSIYVDLSQLESGAYILILSNQSGIYRAPIQKN